MNIFEKIEVFKTEQCHMEASILQLTAGKNSGNKGPSRKRKEERMKIEDKFDAGDYTLNEHFRAVSRRVGFWFNL